MSSATLQLNVDSAVRVGHFLAALLNPVLPSCSVVFIMRLTTTSLTKVQQIEISGQEWGRFGTVQCGHFFYNPRCISLIRCEGKHGGVRVELSAYPLSRGRCALAKGVILLFKSFAFVSACCVFIIYDFI